MQELHDIFRLWGDFSALAAAIGEKPDTVYRWQKNGRIPETAWHAVIVAAAEKGHALTVADLHNANRPPLQRGKPAHKPTDSRVA